MHRHINNKDFHKWYIDQEQYKLNIHLDIHNKFDLIDNNLQGILQYMLGNPLNLYISRMEMDNYTPQKLYIRIQVV